MIRIVGSKLYSLLFFILVSCLVFAYNTINYASTNNPAAIKPQTLRPVDLNRPFRQVSYYNDVKPILDSRCVACHSCYDSPCQLKLSSFEGIDRGASKKAVYDHERLIAQEPSRLYIDETTTADWRMKGFFPVLNEQLSSPEDNLNNSLIARLIQLKRDNPLPSSGKLPKSIELDLERSLQCPSLDEFEKYQRDHPLWGMPYGLPPLTPNQENTLLSWLREGAKADIQLPLSPAATAEIEKWEQFLNAPSLKQQLVARYIYEHLYIGDLHFKDHPANEFYKLVRSRTPPGQTVEELKSIRPFDDPGIERFYYRLRPVTSTIVDKNHFVYELSESRMQRLQELFLKPEYTVTHLPGYDPQSAANPFNTFSQLPAISRYQFLLDDAQYFFSGFIKGPVCRGQAAVNVIRDQFWVAFIKPQNDFMQESTEFLAENSHYLRMPASEGEKIGLISWLDVNRLQQQYIDKKEAFIHKALLRHHDVDFNLIWDGDGHNDNALLTVFRHFDNATVVKGLVGKTPLTAWVVDYPLFERIHYLLVAGFNVYGTAGHQVTTRLYMDSLRMEAENNFLRFIPAQHRKAMRDPWYQGIDAKLFGFFDKPLYGINKETAISYQTSDYKKEFFERVQQRLGPAGGKPDLINRCLKVPCMSENSSPDQQQADAVMRQLADLKGYQIEALPEVSFLRIKTADPEKDLVYTLVRNQKLLNVSFIFAENLRREPEQDTLTVVPGFLGSYPNMFLSVSIRQLPEFIEHLKQTRTEAEKDFFYNRYGIRRNNPEIWLYYDWFNQKYLNEQPGTAGLFDMNRYENL
ncbi:fatty acid cis/trans isomerase [Methylobacter sp. YRD-M1]|uniref:fatty acid cis/trans isomerase n=1 Tax=Methylobacter sp. YRD-M1 TaxID=2911520 RepID=UPI00227BCEBF|nr:fatty acid cis/trans isomerase [Methylobacter sp. YRD-M1]WAK03536.1 fatty acid cis/trans isomerase [Methylobacter sp. YRD-M1]